MVAIRNKPKVIVLRAAGTNCDVETAFAFEHAGARPEPVHINQLVKGEKKLRDYHILAVPGGFTYGDDVGSGKILANELKYKLAGDLEKFVSAGKFIIGICNGFQVLVKSGLLPGKGASGEELGATLTTNDTARYEDRWVYLRAAKGLDMGSQNRCLWTRGVEGMIYMPAAHGEGNREGATGGLGRRSHRMLEGTPQDVPVGLP